MSAGRVVLGVVGACLAVLGVALLAGGGALLWAYGTQRNADGFFTSPVAEMSTEGYAITSSELDLGSVPRGLPSGWLATIQVNATSLGETPVFVGLGPSEETAAYLEDVAVAEVSRIEADAEVRYVNAEGGPPSGLPSEQDFWVESVEGAAAQSIAWDLQPGDWTIVVMNADASPDVAVRMSAGATTNWVGVGMAFLLVGGLFFLVLATVMIVLAFRRPRASGGPVAPAPTGTGIGAGSEPDPSP